MGYSCVFITGPMRSSKTSTLKQRILSTVFQGNIAVVLRPLGDSKRWANDEKRVTHDGQSYLPIELKTECYERLKVIETAKLMDQILILRQLKVKQLFIDEFQFFNSPKDATTFLNEMAKDGIAITVAGLTLDWKREMFATVVECYGMFTEIIQNYASCTKCGKPATFTAKLDKTANVVLEMGDKQYESRCHQCFS